MGGETSRAGMTSRWPIPCGHWALACCLAQGPEASLCMVVERNTVLYTAKYRLRGGGHGVLSTKCGGTAVNPSWRETNAGSYDSYNKLHNYSELMMYFKYISFKSCYSIK